MNRQRLLVTLMSKGLLPFSQNFANYGDGALPSGWTGSTWAISSGAAVNTPTLGSEAFSDPGFDTGAPWILGGGWSISGGECVATAAIGAGGIISQVSVCTNGAWYLQKIPLTEYTTGTGLSPATNTTNTNIDPTKKAVGDNVWTFISVGTTGAIKSRVDALTCKIDNVSLKQITVSTLVAYRNIGTKNQNITGTYGTLTSGTQVGVLANVASDGSSYLAAWIDGTNIKLEKNVAGTWTTLINTTQTPASNKLPQILTTRSGSDLLVELRYNGAMVGTVQTVSDAQIVDNTRAGIFSTYSGNTIATFTAQANNDFASYGAAPAITPTLGSELLTDGGLETWASPTNLTNWVEAGAGTSSVNQEASDVHGGSNACRFDVDASNSNIQISQNIVNDAGDFVFVNGWWKASAAGKTARFDLGSVVGASRTLTTSYVQYFDVIQADLANRGLVAKRLSAASSSVYVDDISAKILTFSTCRLLMGNIGRKNGTYTCHPTVTSGTDAGMLIEYLDDNNFVMAYTDGISAYLLSRIAGTYTTVKSGAITYSAAAELKVIVNGTTHKLYYNGTQVSTDGTIDNSTLGTSVYAFNTYATNTVGTVTTSTAVS